MREKREGEREIEREGKIWRGHIYIYMAAAYKKFALVMHGLFYVTII